MKIEFEKQFGEGTDPWYAKAERWVKKKFKNPYLQHLALGIIFYSFLVNNICLHR